MSNEDFTRMADQASKSAPPTKTAPQTQRTSTLEPARLIAQEWLEAVREKGGFEELPRDER
jgi:hypothetical protein